MGTSYEWIYGGAPRAKPSIHINTRPQRRRAVALIAACLERILSAELRCLSAAARAGRRTEWLCETEQCVQAIEDAMLLLDGAYHR